MFHPVPWIVGGALALLAYDSGYAGHELVLGFAGVILLAIVLNGAGSGGGAVQTTLNTLKQNSTQGAAKAP